MGGKKIATVTKSTMILNDRAGPFIPSDGAVTTTELGTMQCSAGGRSVRARAARIRPCASSICAFKSGPGSAAVSGSKGSGPMNHSQAIAPSPKTSERSVSSVSACSAPSRSESRSGGKYASGRVPCERMHRPANSALSVIARLFRGKTYYYVKLT